MNDILTRYIGLCPCCQKEFKVRGDNLVHHGFQRPGHGHIIGDCFGALKAPHEVSSTTAEEYLVVVTCWLTNDEQALEILPTHTTLGRIGRNGNYVTVEKAVKPAAGWDWDTDRDATLALHEKVRAWDNAYAAREAELKGQIAWEKMEITRLSKLITAWEAKPLKTFEEEASKLKAAKADRDAAKAFQKATKVKEAVAKIQARIDSSVKTKNTRNLASIYESSPSKLRQLTGISTADALALIDRDNVWESIGLKDANGYASLKSDALKNLIYSK